METKKEIRTRLLKQRETFPKEACALQAQEVARKLFLHRWYIGCRRLFCYVSFRNEVDTFAVMQRALQDGKILAVPRVDGKNMNFYQVHDLQSLQKGAYGILEPAWNALMIPEADDLMLLPGAAFDRRGYRIGYGGGYYDRYLKQHKEVKTIGLAYDFQMISKVPEEVFDFPAGMVLYPEESKREELV